MQFWTEDAISWQEIFRRPLSLTAAIGALLLILYEVIQIAGGNLYQKALGGIDGTTLIELGILTLFGVITLKKQTDLQAVSFTLVAGLSVIFLYEAIYWIFWLLVGFPQINGEEFLPKIIQLDLTPARTYLLNRATKAVLFFAYLTVFPSWRGNLE